MTYYLTEQEQIQQLKNWLKQYGLTTLAGIAFALILVFGWHYWRGYQEKSLIHASAVYDEMLILRAQGNTPGALVQARKLLRHYAKTPYAQMGAFMLARDAVLKKNYPEAVTQFKWVIAHSKDKAMRETARLRLARLFIAEQKSKEALSLLEKVDDKYFQGLIDETRGDALMAMNDPSSAKKAYQAALQELPNAEIVRPILQMKVDDLAAVT